MVEKIRPVPVCFTLSLRDQRSKWMQDGCTVYIASHMASNGSCVDSPLNIFKNHLLEVKSNIKPGDHGPPKSHNHWFIIFIMYKENPVCIKKNTIEIAFGWGPGHLWLHATLEGPWPHYMIPEVSLGRPLNTSFGLSHFLGLDSWLTCKVVLRASEAITVLQHKPGRSHFPMFVSKSSRLFNQPEHLVYRTHVV